jgi:hypothetical protein
MTFTSLRIALAKRIAPELISAVTDTVSSKNAMAKRFIDQAVRLEGVVDRHERALRNIIALRTPKAAHAARRMADIAETTLKNREA